MQTQKRKSVYLIYGQKDHFLQRTLNINQQEEQTQYNNRKMKM